MSAPPAHDPSPVAVITGGEGGLAQAIRAELESQQFQVLAPGRTELDVASAASVTRWFAGIKRLDLLICNAGLTVDRSVATMTEAEFGIVLDVNLGGSFRAARAALTLMAKQRIGHIIFIGSYSALSGPAGQAGYAAAKAGLIGLTQSLAREYGARNIRVNCVLPGFLETKMTAHLPDDVREKFRRAHALGQFNSTAAAARFISFLHREMPHTSGQVFSLDSRLHRWT